MHALVREISYPVRNEPVGLLANVPAEEPAVLRQPRSDFFFSDHGFYHSLERLPSLYVG